MSGFLRGCALAVALAAALGASPALAQQQGFALDRYDPASRGSDWFALESLDLRGHLRPAAGVTLDWAHRPLVLHDDSTGRDVAALVTDQLFLHAGGALTLWDRVRVGASVPIALVDQGSAGGTFLPTPSGAALGDVRLDLDARILGAYRGPLTLAGGVQLFLPTGSRDAYTGDGRARLVPRAMAAGRVGPFEYAGKLALDVRFLDTQFAGTRVGSELQVGVAGGVRFLGDALLVGPEVGFATGISRGSAVFARRTTPVELLAGAHYTLLRDFRVGVAAGPGLSRGLGSPELRVLVSLDWAPAPRPERAGGGAERDLARLDVSTRAIRIDEPITFEFDSARLLPESGRVLSAVVRLLRDNPAMKVRIEGHTDNEGGSAYNKDLSERRAASVLRWLVDHGIAAARLSSVGWGDEKPIATNATEEGRQRNRRVEFRIVE